MCVRGDVVLGSLAPEAPHRDLEELWPSVPPTPSA